MATAVDKFATSATARGFLAAVCALSFAVPCAFALDAGDTLRVMTFNVRGCTDETGVRNVAQTANRILAEDPDVCGLQECNASRSAELAAATGLKLFFANDECILSKTEPLSTEVVDLQYYKFYKRILMIVEFDDYIIANTHMSRTSEYGLPEVDVITNALAKYEGRNKPILFMGDINTRPGFYVDNKLTPLMQCISPRQIAVGEGTYHSEMNAEGQYTWEWILDFIYMDFASARSGEWSWTSHVVKDHITSDHAPVVADITCQRIKRRTPTNAWIDEDARTSGLTGAWSGDVVYDWRTFTAALGGRNAFTPKAPSRGSRVTVDVTATFSDIPEEEETPGEDVQGAVWLGTNGCFQVWTKELKVGEDAAWIDVEAEGVTPQTGVEYTFRVVFNYAAGTYSVEVQTGSTGFTRLRGINPVDPENPVQDFPLASSGKAISTIVFNGDGALRSIAGEYVVVEGFSKNDEIVLKDNATAVLSAAQAVWLNSLGAKADVESALAGLSDTKFTDAYLLNFDITKGAFSYSFEITDIDVFDDRVEIAVSLVRDGETKGAVNGLLKFYGAATLEAFKTASEPVSVDLANEDFSHGARATATIPLDEGEVRPAFFKAAIEVPPAE